MFKSYEEVTQQDRTSIWNAGFSDYITPINMTMEELDQRLVNLSLSTSHSKIYYQDNQAVGIYLYGEGCFSNETLSWLGGMAVAPEYRGQEIGLRMLEDFEKTSRQHGVTLMTLDAIDGNDRAIDLYCKFGFEPVQQVAFLKSEMTYQGTSALRLKQGDNLATLGIEEHLTVPWQNKDSHGHDCFLIIDAEQVIGYVVAHKQGETVIINQLTVSDPQKHVGQILIALNAQYSPTSWIGSNLAYNSEVTKELEKAGFKVTVTQHQYIKKNRRSGSYVS